MENQRELSMPSQGAPSTCGSVRPCAPREIAVAAVASPANLASSDLSDRCTRARRLAKAAGIALVVGLVYAVFFAVTGIGVPCVFHELTGLLCPGCGVSRMCLDLLRLDFEAAFHHNAAILCLLPAGAVLAAVLVRGYVCEGSMRLPTWANVLVIAMVVVLLVFGVVRNLM
ncbi:DUF2752 domain-containing protein [Adlercreutzia sp. ZJ138]|uniref:DUF2752 domain-containing protein n=1 Tax=Adlercreutzia sp. ZJ138 TaxID=2709405 RepID=UPI0019807911|nr:DUF2752 domain-containing protein [Adlercreutzia sp. ZJ138]